jgi:PhnB protein
MPVKPKPERYHSVTPLLSVKGAVRLIDFLRSAFGATELSRFPTEGSEIMHAEMKIGDSVVMLGEAMEGYSPPMPAALYVYVADTDATYRSALEAGGESVESPGDRFWGDRTAVVRDFAGNLWWIATHMEDLDSEEIARRSQSQAA